MVFLAIQAGSSQGRDAAESEAFDAKVADDAAAVMTSLWKLREKSEATESHNDVFWMAAMMLADLALKQGDADGADAWFGQAIRLVPDNWLAYFRLGEKKLAEGDIACAAELLEKAAAIGIGPTLLPLDLNALSGRLEMYLLKIRHMSKATA